VSKKSLANTAGFDRSTARYIENPENNPTLLNLIRYALAPRLSVCDQNKTLCGQNKTVVRSKQDMPSRAEAGADA